MAHVGVMLYCHSGINDFPLLREVPFFGLIGGDGHYL